MTYKIQSQYSSSVNQLQSGDKSFKAKTSAVGIIKGRLSGLGQLISGVSFTAVSPALGLLSAIENLDVKALFTPTLDALKLSAKGFKNTFLSLKDSKDVLKDFQA